MTMEKSKKLGKFSLVCEDELGLIVNKIKDPDDRRSFSEVCKDWFRVEGLHRSSLRLLRPKYLRQVLPRFPNLVILETSKCITDSELKFLGESCPRLEAIKLDANECILRNTDFVGFGLLAIAKGCPKLSKVSLRHRRSITGSIYRGLIDLASNLTHLDLSFCLGVSDEAVEAIASSHSIIELSLKGNSVITDRAVGYLANGNCSYTLKTLILTWVKNLTDVGVSHLETMHCLEHLSLACYESGHLTDISGVAISAITTLRKLCLEGLYNLSDHTVVALARNCPNIEILDLSGCRGITGAGIRAFSGHQCLETICLRLWNVIDSDLDHLVLGCRSLKSIVMLKYLERSMRQMRESTKKLVEWRPLEERDILNLSFFRRENKNKNIEL